MATKAELENKVKELQADNNGLQSIIKELQDELKGTAKAAKSKGPICKLGKKDYGDLAGSYECLAGVRLLGRKYSPVELADNPTLVAQLVEKGSGILKKL